MPIRSIDKPKDLPSLVYQALWSDSSADVLYSFGGDTSWLPPVNRATFQNRFQKFIPDGSGGGSWSPDLGRTDQDVPDDIKPPVGGFVSQAKGTGFYLGGYEPFAAVFGAQYRRPAKAVAQRGIVAFDFEGRTWTNDTVRPYTDEGGSVGYGAMHHVPNIGPAGLLVIFGGESEEFNIPSKQLMDKITIYEPKGKTWHHQVATGDVLPRYRQAMCTVGVREGGQESYEMYAPHLQANWRLLSPSKFLAAWLMRRPLISRMAVTRAHLGLIRTSMTYGSCRSRPSSGSGHMEALLLIGSVTPATTWATGT